jgi:glycine hydroxymethyltransferase
MGLDLPSGGHLSHGYQVGDKKLTASAIYFTSKSYKTNTETGLLDYDEIELAALEHKPKMLICGGSAYPRDWDYKRFREIADKIGAYLLCDMAHISGIVATGHSNNPFLYCDVVTTTTHKTLRGPRGALIFCRQKYKKVVDSAVFPGCQGGPHNNVIAGIAVALQEALDPEFSKYIKHVILNSQLLAKLLIEKGFTIVTGGTDNHLLLWDLRPENITGSKLEKICEYCNITLNKNTVPGDKSALSPGGVRIGMPAMTTRGFDFINIYWLVDILEKLVKKAQTIQEKSGKKLKDFEAEMIQDWELDLIKDTVQRYASTFSLP